MPRTTIPSRSRRRSSAPALVIVVAVIGLALLLNGWPFVVSLVGFSTASAIDPGPPARTEIVRAQFAPAPESRGGICAERSRLVPRSDAWRCEVGGAVLDPCFEAVKSHRPASIVCAAEPLSGAPGFTVGGASPPPASSAPALDPAQFGNLFYLIDRIGTPVKLVNGQYYAPYVESVGQGVLVGLSGMRASGDLDRDGDPDAAVLLVADATDDRMFIYLGAILNENGAPARTTAIELGDRVKVDDLSIEHGQIVVTMTTHDADDPACCPTLDVAWSYTLQGEQLAHYVDGWRMELQGGVQCLPFTTAQAGAAADAGPGAQLVYQCSDGSWLRSGLRPGTVWYAESTGSALPETAQDRQPAQARSPYRAVVRIWQ